MGMKGETPEIALTLLTERFPEAVVGTRAPLGEATAVVRPEFLIRTVEFLKKDPRLEFDFLVDITAVDRGAPAAGAPAGAPAGGEGAARFTVVYQFLSLRHKRRLRLEVAAGEPEPVVDSLTPLWGSANWLEREVWDMFGIRFRGHPDLRRILMYEEFEGHPLRKDYPVDRRQPLIGPKI
ncbi:MAG: NADH-quinone oxidoreductase subunit C [Acidobacteria bacterium]|nr:NADH-quinone oxidoreductase subunit C [Acidobacteriota bacterium]